MSAAAAVLLTVALFCAVTYNNTQYHYPAWAVAGLLIAVATTLINRARRGGDR